MVRPDVERDPQGLEKLTFKVELLLHLRRDEALGFALHDVQFAALKLDEEVREQVRPPQFGKEQGLRLPAFVSVGSTPS